VRIGWIGFHVEGVPALRAVVERGYRVEGVLTLTPAAAAHRSGAADYAGLCRQLGLSAFEIEDVNGPDGLAALGELDLDLAFVIGWTQLVRPEARGLVRDGLIGAHASLLPSGRGRAPVNWTLVRGEARTGNTLLWLDDAVDGGDVIDQTVIPVSAYDTCATLYDRVAESNRDMILRALPRLLRGERPGFPQPPSAEPPLPRRRPEDGRVDWSQPSQRVYDLVRAVTRPYPGAFGWLGGRRWRIWRCALLPGEAAGTPGEVVGSVCSPSPASCGQVVQCGRGQVLLLEVEDEDGEVVHGRRLSEQRWAGRSWSDG
jgi:methionyl-tRNA formyltransferase